MKKTIIILILVVYVASIAVVNFFGLEIKVFDGIEYVTNIQCDTITVHRENEQVLTPSMYLGETPVFEFDFIPSSDEGGYTDDPSSVAFNPNAVELNYEIFPHLAAETDVKFEYDEEAMAGIAVFREDLRTLIFLKDGMFTITIKAEDGSNVSTTIKIRAVAPAQA